MPEIIEFYGDYEPPFDVAAVVRKLLAFVPPRALAGLRSIVVTTSAQLPASERRRKVRQRQGTFRGAAMRGCYRTPRRGTPASIELYVDNMVKACGPEELRREETRELVVGSTLFHEIGHHVHRLHEPRRIDSEVVAEEWESRLLAEVEQARGRPGAAPPCAADEAG